MTKEQRRERLESIGLTQTEFRGLSDLANETLLRHRAQWKKKDEDEQEAWFFDLGQLVKECGLTRVCAAMRAAWTRIQFLPSAPELREYLPPPEAAKPFPRHDHRCAECSGSGWKIVEVFSAQYGRKHSVAKRCDCNTQPHKTRDAAAAISSDIDAKMAELEAKLSMPGPPQRKSRTTSAPLTTPAIQISADEIQRRRPAEVIEIFRTEQEASA